MKLQIRILVFFLLLSLIPIIALGGFSLLTMSSTQSTIIDDSSDSLITISKTDLEEITFAYSDAINDYFTNVENQLDQAAEFMSHLWQDQYYIDLFEDTNEYINDRYFYGEIDADVNGTVAYYQTLDYVDYDDNGINDFIDTAADFLGGANLTIDGRVDISVYGSYSGLIAGTGSFIKIRYIDGDGNKIKLNIVDDYAANGNQFSSDLIDNWSATNADGLTGNLAALNTELLGLGATYIYPYFYVYDNDTHNGDIRTFGDLERFEGTIAGEINGTYNGMIRGRLDLTTIGSTDERLSIVDEIMSQLYKQNQPTFSWVYLGIPDTGYLYQYPWNPDYVDGTWIYMGPTYDCRTRAWYTETMDAEANVIASNASLKGKESFWTDLNVDANTRAVSMNIGHVIYDENGDLVGPLEFKLEIAEVQQTVLDLTVGSSGYGFIINDEGDIIASPDYLNSTSAVPLSSADDYQSGNLLATNDTVLKAVITKMVNGETGIEEAVLDNNRAIIAYAPIESTGWSFGVVLSEKEIIAPTKDLENSISSTIGLTVILTVMVFIGTAIIVFGMGLWLSKNITDPITQMTNMADEISRGNFEVNLDEFKSEDEIGQLASAFDRMAMSLKILMKK